MKIVTVTIRPPYNFNWKWLHLQSSRSNIVSFQVGDFWQYLTVLVKDKSSRRHIYCKLCAKKCLINLSGYNYTLFQLQSPIWDLSNVRFNVHFLRAHEHLWIHCVILSIDVVFVSRTISKGYLFFRFMWNVQGYVLKNVKWDFII